MNANDKHADWLLKPTANELADIQAFKTEELTIWERNHTATMLRQQQAEIEALKQIIDANNLNQNIGQFVKPTNKPVAWMHQNPDYAISKHQSLEYNIPLYTHPVKELTDEEIWEVVSLKWWDWEDSFDVTGFARAILRKAQENDN